MSRNSNPRLLDHPITALQPTNRARKACEHLGVSTVTEFLLTSRDAFLAVPGCGARTYDELEELVRTWLARNVGDPDAGLDGSRPLQPLVEGEPYAAALRTLELNTVGDFLAMPRSLGIKALGRPVWQRVFTAIERTRRMPPATAPLLPDSLKQLPLTRAALPQHLMQQLEDLGCTTIGHALTLPAALFEEGHDLGPAAAKTFRQALDQLFRTALEHLDATDPSLSLDWPTLRGRLTACLEEEDRQWFCIRVGIPGHADGRTIDRRGRDSEEIVARDAAVREQLAQRAPTLHFRLRQEVLRELEAFEGIVRADRLAVGSLLHTLAKGSGDAELPLRLASFCWPEEWHVHNGYLTTLPARGLNRVLHKLRGLCAPRHLPRPLEEIEQEVSSTLAPVPRGLLVHMLSETFHLRMHIDPHRGELVLAQQREPSARLAALLHEEGSPTHVVDLVFHYRERYRTAHRLKLQSHLRRDPTFLEIGPDVWSLRTWHEDELAVALPLAHTAERTICEQGHRRSLTALLPDESVRTRHLVLAHLRQSPHVRYLGRGEFCAATQSMSTVLDELLRDFRKAMGEVPMSRFVENQPVERRRLVQRLLNENRLFVFPSPDRIDVLTNYPFNPERLSRLLTLVDEFLHTHSGYAPLSSVLEEVNRCELGGSWLHPVLLGELLRRHGPFEVLPGEFVARQALGLGGWLMRRARNALRDAGVAISLQELLIERPELAEFKDCLAALLQRDPLVQRPDGSRFQIA